MAEQNLKAFDCVRSMRQIRDRLSAEIADMSYYELVQWLRTPSYSNPTLRRLAERAQQAKDQELVLAGR